MKTEEKCFRGRKKGEYLLDGDRTHPYIYLPQLLEGFNTDEEIEIIVRKVEKE